MKKQNLKYSTRDLHSEITKTKSDINLYRRGSLKGTTAITQQDNHHVTEVCSEGFSDKKIKPFRITPIVVTANETILTDVDIRSLVDMGLSIIRFRMTMISRSHQIKLLECLEHAEAWMCEKYGTSAWPLAKCLDLPNATIRTGYIDENIKDLPVIMKENSIVTVTSDVQYWNKCSGSLIYIDDTHTLKHFTPGVEMTLYCGIVLHCQELMDKHTAKFKVTIGGEFEDHQYVCLRSVMYRRPSLMKRDLDLIKFAQKYRFDVLSIYTVRSPTTILMLRKLLGNDYKPLILSVICDQQGLDCAQDIIDVRNLILIHG
ncbi:uncharacterized protein LOC113231839 [Hyposmocoma kahamanoa]|uniref:uncharacterized protein LOC113231839 n=1 Tax=Hyposmocoma kahamanoa TaxID=1477025 RepID=UPI000E6D7015|nr:uncharacterized protein LOC113231839 [Hyposmocoma kahamanoa]